MMNDLNTIGRIDAEALEDVQGSVERVVFQNTDNGWCVLKVRIKGRRKFATLVGHCPFVTVGEGVEARGQWTDHPSFGERFLADSMHATLPRAAVGAEKYLSSGLVKGIGPALAKRMVARFGAGVFDVIEEVPDLLRDVEGIGPARVASIRAAWAEQKALRRLMEFLGAHGISVSKAPRILRTLGSDAVSIIEKNPYRLARDVPGVGFKSADLIARHLRLPMNAEERFASALHDRLANAIGRGHCAFPIDDLVRRTRELVGGTDDDIQSALDSEIESGRLIEETLSSVGRAVDCVMPESLARSERNLARRLVVLASKASAPPWSQKLSPVPDPSIRLSVAQKQALETLLRSKVSLLTGGPGTGKTTLLRSLAKTVSAAGCRVLACAPTGRAAQRMASAAGIEAQTIHRLLGWDHETNGFRFRRDLPLWVDLLIVDEASMIGLELMDALLDALPDRAAVVLVGDVDQLPSVQPGRVLDSLIEAQKEKPFLSHVHLEEVFRQSAVAKGHESEILKAARDVLAGRMPSWKASVESDFHFIETRDPNACADLIVQLVGDRIPKRFGLDPIDEIQVISPLHRGLVGARALNRRLREALNPHPADQLDRFGVTYAVGDKVIVTLNDYDKDVFNGDIGRILQIERDRQTVKVELGPGRRVEFDFTELDSLQPAYAITIHKAQGSEYEAVVIPLLEESAPLLSRNLLYTALTRGRRLAIVVGSREALKLALRADSKGGSHGETRWSGLGGRLVLELQRAIGNN